MKNAIRLARLATVTWVLSSATHAALISVYEFDETSGNTAVDAIRPGSGDGTLFNFSGLQWVPGKIGNCVDLDGANDHINALNTVPTGSTAFSLSVWVFADAGSNWNSIVKNWGGTVVGSFHFGFNANTGRIGNYLTNGTTVQAPSNLPLGTWHHLAVTYNGAANTQKLYVNGKLAATETNAPASLTALGTRMGIGVKLRDNQTGADTGVPGYWNGKLDDLAFWDETLSDPQILLIRNLGELGIGVLDSLVDDDEDGLPDAWERLYGLDPTDDGSRDINNGPNGNPDSAGGDTLTNLQELQRGTHPINADTDDDGWLDQVETHTGIFIDLSDTGTDPTKEDTDGDGLEDPAEYAASTDPFNPDSDNDTLPDGWEVRHSLDPNDDGSENEDHGPQGDPDEDFSTNRDEFIRGTNPRNPDTDGDGLIDGDENNTGIWSSEFATGTDPLKPDSDGDGFHDGAETNTGIFISYNYTSHTGNTGTSPNIPDTDGDGLPDGVEDNSGSFTSPTRTGTNPNVVDSDGDGMSDGYEVANQFDPTDDGSTDPVNGPLGDPDEDGFTNLEEFERGSNPRGTTGFFTSTHVDSIPQEVASSDLLQTHLASVAAASDWTTNTDRMNPATVAGLLSNGTFETANTTPVSLVGFSGETGDWIEFNLDLTTHTAGYDISRIATFATWLAYRSRQAYSIEVRPVGGDWITFAPTTEWTRGAAVDDLYTKVSHLSNGAAGTPILRGIGAVRIRFADVVVQPIAFAVYREIDVIGAPTPITDSISLEVLGFHISTPGAFDMRANGLNPARRYILRRSSTLDGAWVDVGLPFTPASPTVDVSDPSPAAGKAFYQLQERP
jgi:hypothetical protein